MSFKKIIKTLLNILEIYIPVIMLVLLFAAFLIGIFSRYVLKNPQSWTYELSTVTFLYFVVLSGCYVHRVEKHISFDMFFLKMSTRTQCIMRIISNILIFLTCAALIPATLKFLGDMDGLYTQVMKIPRGMVFSCFLILFITSMARAGYRAYLDAKAFAGKTYAVPYFDEGKETDK